MNGVVIAEPSSRSQGVLYSTGKNHFSLVLHREYAEKSVTLKKRYELKKKQKKFDASF